MLRLSLLQIKTGVQWEADGKMKAILAAAGLIFVLSGASAVRSDDHAGSTSKVPVLTAHAEVATR
jgi:hypothetical protein